MQNQVLSRLLALEIQGLAIGTRTAVYNGKIVVPRKTPGGGVTRVAINFNTGRIGWPDVTSCIAGRFVGIELKIDSAVSAEQKIIHERIRKAGGEVWVVRSVDEFNENLRRIIPAQEEGLLF